MCYEIDMAINGLTNTTKMLSSWYFMETKSFEVIMIKSFPRTLDLHKDAFPNMNDILFYKKN